MEELSKWTKSCLYEKLQRTCQRCLLQVGERNKLIINVICQMDLDHT